MRLTSWSPPCKAAQKGHSFPSPEMLPEGLHVISTHCLETLNLAFQAFGNTAPCSIAHQCRTAGRSGRYAECGAEEPSHQASAKRCLHRRASVTSYQDLLTNIERISDHCSNIAGVLIEIDEQKNIHKYLYKTQEEGLSREFEKVHSRLPDRYYLVLGPSEESDCQLDAAEEAVASGRRR
ncbi:MAG: hypothetical protein ACLUSL_11580 [Ruminococcus sp.]